MMMMMMMMLQLRHSILKINPIYFVEKVSCMNFRTVNDGQD